MNERGILQVALRPKFYDLFDLAHALFRECRGDPPLRWDHTMLPVRDRRMTAIFVH